MPEEPTWDDEAGKASLGPLAGHRSVPQDLLELDYVYEALAHPRRRYLCCTLRGDTQWTLTDLATKIAAYEAELPENAVTDHQRERAYVSLYHAHVPKLADLGVISFDEVTELITPAENADQVVAVLEEIDPDRQEVYTLGDMNDQDR